MASVLAFLEGVVAAARAAIARAAQRRAQRDVGEGDRQVARATAADDAIAGELRK